MKRTKSKIKSTKEQTSMKAHIQQKIMKFLKATILAKAIKCQNQSVSKEKRRQFR